jgi:hypothetical protein
VVLVGILEVDVVGKRSARLAYFIEALSETSSGGTGCARPAELSARPVAMAEAAAEFQKILDHRAIVISDPIGGRAHGQQGRA